MIPPASHGKSSPGFQYSALEFLFGVIGVVLVTLTAIKIHPWDFPSPASVGPGTISLVLSDKLNGIMWDPTLGSDVAINRVSL